MYRIGSGAVCAPAAAACVIRNRATSSREALRPCRDSIESKWVCSENTSSPRSQSHRPAGRADQLCLPLIGFWPGDLFPLAARLSRAGRFRSSARCSASSTPRAAVLLPEFYNQLVAMHGTIMVFLGGRAAGGRGVRQLPGAAEDRRAGHGVSAAEHVELLAVPGRRARDDRQLFRAGGRGPIRLDSTRRWRISRPMGQTLAPRHVRCSIMSSLLGSINMIATIVQLRAPGLTLIAAAVLHLGAARDGVPAAAGVSAAARRAAILQLMDRLAGTSFFSQRPGRRRPAAVKSPAAATRCCGSTCSGSSPTPRSTSSSFRRWASSPK